MAHLFVVINDGGLTVCCQEVIKNFVDIYSIYRKIPRYIKWNFLHTWLIFLFLNVAEGGTLK